MDVCEPGCSVLSCSVGVTELEGPTLNSVGYSPVRHNESYHENTAPAVGAQSHKATTNFDGEVREEHECENGRRSSALRGNDQRPNNVPLQSNSLDLPEMTASCMVLADGGCGKHQTWDSVREYSKFQFGFQSLTSVVYLGQLFFWTRRKNSRPSMHSIKQSSALLYIISISPIRIIPQKTLVSSWKKGNGYWGLNLINK